MISRFHQLSFRKKLLLSFATLSFLPVLLTGIAAYRLYTNFIFNTTEKSSVETIDLVCDDIDSLLNDTRSLCAMLTGDIKMQEYLRMDFKNISDQYSNDLAGSMELASLSTYRKDIFGFYVLGLNGGRYKSNYYSLKSEDQRTTRWYQTILNSPEASWFPPHEGSFIVRSSISDRFITVGVPFVDKASGLINGIVAADIQVDAITQKMKHGFTNGVLCIIDNGGDILFSSNAGNDTNYPIDLSPELIATIARSAPDTSGKSILVPDSRYLIVSRTLEDPNWCIAGIIDRDFLTQSSKDITTIVMLLLLIIAFSALHFAMRISESVYRPVERLSAMMENVENGDLSVRISPLSSPEFDRLGKSFNQMLDRIESLIKQIYEEQAKLKNSELKALQAQIQPHFLYNSLDSVIWLLRMDRNGDAEKMLTELSTLFKISLSKGREIITIQEELKHVGSYLFITNMIYGKKFEYAIDCDPSLHAYQTLKLMLQPLVENVIVHAVPLPGEKIFISVRVYEEEQDLVLSVSDRSMGMDVRTVSELRQQIFTSSQSDSHTSGYGLYNVNERIHILFGSGYGLFLTSTPGEGTEVRLRIPLRKGDEKLVPGNTL